MIPIPTLSTILAAVLISAHASTLDSRQACPGPTKGNPAPAQENTVITTIADARDARCKGWYAIRDGIMRDIFKGRCTDNARAATRLAFHDAAPYSIALGIAGKPNGAADGSLLVDPNEVLRPDNNGLQHIVSLLRPLPAKYGVSAGDILHLAGNLGVIACPGGPAIKTYIGRPAPHNINPDGLLPNTHAPVPVLTSRFADMGFSIRELMALIGAHSTSKQRFVDPSRANFSLDSTVDIWDVLIYSEASKPTPPPGVFILPSDAAFSHYPTTKKDFNRFVGQQEKWESEYSKAHEKMSLLGQNPAALVECTEILPPHISFDEIQGANGAVDPALLAIAMQKYRSIWL